MNLIYKSLELPFVSILIELKLVYDMFVIVMGLVDGKGLNLCDMQRRTFILFLGGVRGFVLQKFSVTFFFW